MASQTKSILKLWAGLAGIFIFLLLWVSQTVRSTWFSYDIQKIKNEIAKNELVTVNLLMQRDQLLSLEAIERAAKQELGLIVPKEENIIIINVKQG